MKRWTLVQTMENIYQNTQVNDDGNIPDGRHTQIDEVLPPTLPFECQTARSAYIDAERVDSRSVSEVSARNQKKVYAPQTSVQPANYHPNLEDDSCFFFCYSVTYRSCFFREQGPLNGCWQANGDKTVECNNIADRQVCVPAE